MSGDTPSRPPQEQPVLATHGQLWRALLLLQGVDLWKTAAGACLGLAVAFAGLAAMGGAPTPHERAALVAWGIRSGVTAVVIATLLIPAVLEPWSNRRAEALRELGVACSWVLLLSCFVSLLLVAFALFTLSITVFNVVLLFVGTEYPFKMILATTLQFILYILPTTAIALSIKFLPFGVAERALFLAILGLVSHRIVTPLALPLDLVSLHPAGEAWLLSTRSLGESARISLAGTLGGLLLAAAALRAQRHR